MTIATSNHSIAQHRFECIQACLDCARMCNACGDDMIGMSHEGGEANLMTRCIRLCRDCSDICLLAAQWMGRTSAFAVQLCALCAEICEVCAGVCEQHAPHHALCGECATACRRCAVECHKMVMETVPSSSGGTA